MRVGAARLWASHSTYKKAKHRLPKTCQWVQSAAPGLPGSREVENLSRLLVPIAQGHRDLTVICPRG